MAIGLFQFCFNTNCFAAEDIYKECKELFESKKLKSYEMLDINHFCKAKREYYTQLKDFRKNLKETKIKIASSILL